MAAESKSSCFLFMTFFFILFMISSTSGSNTTTTYNVLSFGAKPDGVTDSAEPFLRAWSAACASPSGGAAVIYVPRGNFTLGPLVFEGCNSNNNSQIIIWKIEGTLVGPPDYRVLGQTDEWIAFKGVDGVSVVGGTLDARGAALWDCKTRGGANCPDGATTLQFTDSNNINITGLTSLNSQKFNIKINVCQNVHIQEVIINAADHSPNTDGIHIQLSTKVVIINSTIRTGDDCISIGPGTKNLWIEGIACGPGHGISIGSLGNDLEEPGVQNVTVKRTVFTDTENGVRIKSWARPSHGFVQRIQFLDAIMQNVQNPILIDQNYCPDHSNCPHEVSGIQISSVLYQDIRGTSIKPVAIKFDCSERNPCQGIVLDDINLHCLNETAQSLCVNVNGKAFGKVQPNSCL